MESSSPCCKNMARIQNTLQDGARRTERDGKPHRRTNKLQRSHGRRNRTKGYGNGNEPVSCRGNDHPATNRLCLVFTPLHKSTLYCNQLRRHSNNTNDQHSCQHYWHRYIRFNHSATNTPTNHPNTLRSQSIKRSRKRTRALPWKSKPSLHRTSSRST